MHYVYIFRSKTYGRMYVGYTTNLKRRVREHRIGKGHTTKKVDSFELIFYEAFKSKLDAQRREKYFKTTKGKRTLKLMLKEYLAPVV